MENFEKYATLSYMHSIVHHFATMVLHNFDRAHEINNDVERFNSTWGTSRRSERGHYDLVAYMISILDETEMKEVRDSITASICADDN